MIRRPPRSTLFPTRRSSDLVLHVTVEPNTKVELNELEDAVVVPLVDYESTLKSASGQTTKLERVAGKPGWVPAGGREFEAGSKGVDALLIEIKPTTK